MSYKPKDYIGRVPIGQFCVDLLRRQCAGEISREELEQELNRALPLTMDLFTECSQESPHDTLLERDKAA